MAKRRRLTAAAATQPPKTAADKPRLQPLLIAVGLLGGAVVYVSYHPSDSVSVERGNALWFSALGIVIAIVTCSHFLRRRENPLTRNAGEASDDSRAGDQADSGEQRDPGDDSDLRQDLASPAWVAVGLDLAPWLLGLWMMVAAVASCPPGNLRMATNEAWLWVAGAAVFTASRRLTRSLSARRALLLLMVVCASGLAIHGLYQQFVSLEETRQQYREDPEGVLRMTGIDAPVGSAERMVFENRLFDGGPTGTFALANSLAAALLVGVVGAFGILRFHWGAMATGHRLLWLIVMLLCGGCLLATRSRSGLLAAIIGVALALLLSLRLRESSRRVVTGGIVAVTLVGVLVGIGLAAFGNREWFEQAPASLAFRFQYWRSTVSLAADSPVWGAGPGNFQSMYERYREPSAHEQVAEPHNFFFEALASGGVIAVALLALAAICGALWLRSSSRREGHAGAQRVDESDRWVWLGAGLGLVLVWLLGFASASTPDLDAHLFVVPAVVAFAFLLSPSVQSLGWRELDSIAIVILASLLIHLSVAGGWTVPGVAISLWVLAAILTRVSPQSVAASGTVSIRSRANFIIVMGMFALAAIWFVSIRPVESSRRALAEAEFAQIQRRLDDVESSLEQAMAVDPWSPAAAIWLADYDRWQMVMSGDRADWRKRWVSHLAEARRRGGDDPAVYRMIGNQQLHLYQRFGQQPDLVDAMETFSTAARWAPSDEATAAQLAVVAAALNRDDVALESAKRAQWLSEQGGNIERALERQHVYVAEPIGPAAISGPFRRPASELLSNQLDKPGVASQTE